MVKTTRIPLEQTHKVAGEHIASSLPARLVKQFSRPPPVFWGGCHRDDIAGLEIELFVDSRGVIIEGFHCGSGRC